MKLIYAFLIILSILIVSSTCLYLVQQNKYIENGDCFDNRNNKINGVDCDITIYPILDDMGIAGVFFMTIIVTLLALSIIAMLITIITSIGGINIWD